MEASGTWHENLRSNRHAFQLRTGQPRPKRATRLSVSRVDRPVRLHCRMRGPSRPLSRIKRSRDGSLGRRCFLGICDRPGKSADRGLGTGVEIIPLDRPLARTRANLGGAGPAGAGSEIGPRATAAPGARLDRTGSANRRRAAGRPWRVPPGPPRRPAQSWTTWLSRALRRGRAAPAQR